MVLVFMLAAYIAIAWLLSLLASGGRPRTALRAVTSLFLRVGFFVGGVRLHIRGKREATGTIVSNHCSYLDVLIHAHQHGVKNVWYWGFLSRLLDCLYVAHARSVQDTTARGAFVGGVPVQPVVLRYRYRHFSPTWESIPTSIHVFWLLASFVHDVDVIYLPTYTPTKMERQNPQTYADNMQRVSWRDDPFYCSSCHRAHVSS
ncbi:phospholipid/glycerol acyltransferase, putative [Acanthamoeba castellanii str. Neff]|uniref:Phospholipid/glycerol acyltransferase, putative n=1 Tax=Acanthamoeba castellanii (strain ATCC 30010 / Neff) TaxID=1257118 RepID=L8GX94_ACACF|nr:phospholipid/glycerol acyltransferase, putative [Acanthamoeba castellanii str. Neff]ELR17567.1 phospholipid/glycerol acyltransferase, putative [Acanthamoeba castellanii str. Neff]